MPNTETLRATMEELKDFANKVREAGGGNPIDALMPSVPEDSEKCLIARNLNFNCHVAGAGEFEDPSDAYDDSWAMHVADEATRDRIAAALDLPKCYDTFLADDGHNVPHYGVVLPKNIGQVAADFDHAQEVLNSFNIIVDDHVMGYYIDKPMPISKAAKFVWDGLEDEERQFLIDFMPYISESEDEAYKLATQINEDGSITL